MEGLPVFQNTNATVGEAAGFSKYQCSSRRRKMEVLMNLLEEGKSPYQVVSYGRQFLQKAGFEELAYDSAWNLQCGNKYFVSPYASMLLAFTVGKSVKEKDGKIKIAMAHTDFPCFKLKPKSEFKTKNYLQVNVEPYGGMIKSTWFDRPLGLAGKVMLESDDVYHPRAVLFESHKPLFTIPSLAAHMTSKANAAKDYDMQKELQPITAMIAENCNKEDFLLRYLAKELDVKKQQILSFDLYVYNADAPQVIGMNGEFLSAPRIDNLASVAALLEGIEVRGEDHVINMIALFDHEEIGSRSKQGADSHVLSFILRKMGAGLDIDELEFHDKLTRGFLLSVDGAHGLHPNYSDKSDTTNEVFLGSGPVIKTSASQRYISDSEGTAVLRQLCRQHQIPIQVQVNRSGMPGGQTLGPVVSSYLPMPGADLGIPMLAMHSARELMNIRDYEELVKMIRFYFV